MTTYFLCFLGGEKIAAGGQCYCRWGATSLPLGGNPIANILAIAISLAIGLLWRGNTIATF